MLIILKFEIFIKKNLNTRNLRAVVLAVQKCENEMKYKGVTEKIWGEVDLFFYFT